MEKKLYAVTFTKGGRIINILLVPGRDRDNAERILGNARGSCSSMPDHLRKSLKSATVVTWSEIYTEELEKRGYQSIF